MKIFQSVISPLRSFLRDENGATAIEYAMIAAGIGVAVAGTVMTLGSKLNGMLSLIHI